MTMGWRIPLLCAMTLLPPSAGQGQARWMLASRESGCVGLDILVRMEHLSQAPASPEEFVAMIQPRYPNVTVGLPDGFPADMAGKAVMVRYAENRAPIFLRADLCGVVGTR